MKRFFWRIFGALLFAAAQLPSVCSAAQFEITPFAGHTWGGTFSDGMTGNIAQVDDAGSYGLIVGFQQDARSQIELYVSHLATQVLTGTGPFIGKPAFDLDIEYYHIGGTYTEAEGRVKPYVAGGFGATHMVPKGPGLNNETRLSLNLGVGLRIEATERVGFRLEGRWFGTLFNGSGAVFCSNGACALQVEGDLLSQFVTNAGVYVAF